MKKKSILWIIYVVWALLIVFSACKEEKIFSKFSEHGLPNKIENIKLGSSSEK